MGCFKFSLALGFRSHALSSPPVDEDGIQEDTLGHKTCVSDLGFCQVAPTPRTISMST